MALGPQKRLLLDELADGAPRRRTSITQAFDKSRKCTDIPCLVILVFYWVCMLVIGLYAHAYGNVDKVTHGFDWSGDICGVDESVRSKPDLYWCKVEEGVLSDPICVAGCPSDATTSHRCPREPVIKRGTTEPTTENGPEFKSVTITRKLELTPDVQTRSVLHYCLPTQDNKLMEAIAMSPVVSGLGVAFRSVLDAKWFLLFVSVSAVVFNFAFLSLLQGYIRTIIHLLFAAVVLSFLALGAWCLTTDAPQNTPLASPYANPLTSYLRPEVAKKVDLVIGSLFFVLAAAIACFWCSASEAIRHTTDSVKGACVILRKIPMITLQPLLQVTVQLCCVVVIVFRITLVVSLGKVVATNAFDVDPAFLGLPLSVKGLKKTFQFSAEQEFMIFFVMFGSVWIYEVVAAAGHFAIAYAVAKEQDGDPPCWPITRGYCNGVLYHMGTLATGAFIIGVLRILHALVSALSVDGDLRRRRGEKPNPVTQIISHCCFCCVGCLTWVTENVNDLAYVEVVLSGRNYFDAAKQVVRNTVANPGTATIVLGTMRAIRSVGLISASILGALGTYWTLANPQSVAFLDDLGLYTGSGYLQAEIIGITAMSGVICWLVTLAFMNMLLAITHVWAYTEIMDESRVALGSPQSN